MKLIFVLLIFVSVQCAQFYANDNTTCPQGKFYNVITKTCDQCFSFCQQCYSATKCIECITGYILNPYRTICAPMCMIGYFYNASSKFCAPCDISCSSCLDATSCLTCNTNITGLIKNDSGKCICPQSYYLSIDNEACLSCIPNCVQCTDNSTCNQCEDSYILQFSAGQQQCVKECNGSQYFDKSESKCLPCTDSNCLECVDKNQCSACINGFSVYNNISCIRSCPEKYYYSVISKSCNKCFPNCLLCDNQNTCLMCSSLYELTANCTSCQPICMNGEYYNGNLLECSVCPVQCETCSSEALCNSCNSNIKGLIMSKTKQGICECQAQMYWDSEAQNCKDCPKNCLSCSKDNQCELCKPPSYIWNQTIGECQRLCESDQFYNALEGQCVGCSDNNCMKCSVPFECEECKSQYFLFENICVRICPMQKFYNYSQQRCQSCPIYCAYCDNDMNCLSCLPGYQLNNSSECISSV